MKWDSPEAVKIINMQQIYSKNFVSRCNVAYYVMQLKRCTDHLQLTDRTPGTTTYDVMPCVRMNTRERHAELLGTTAGRLSSIPVGVVHRLHCITVRVSWCHSPDERRTASRIYALSSRPKMAGFVTSSWFQCSLLKHSTLQQMLYACHWCDYTE